jgi:hypothetical protein
MTLRDNFLVVSAPKDCDHRGGTTLTVGLAGEGKVVGVGAGTSS